MKIFDRYIFKNLFVSSLFIAITLAVVIVLTQSLRFLELIIEAGASGATFWILTLLALPRFFEIILPLALMIAIIFTYNRMTSDSELVVGRAVGYSPLALAKPALILAGLITIILWSVTMWIAPNSLATLQAKRQEVKAQFSSLIFRQGVFNQVGKGLTVYAREKSSDGTLYGLMIHDARESVPNPSTIIAKRGTLSVTLDGFRVTVFEGQRQEFDREKKTLSRLNFDRYAIDLPDKDPVIDRWQQPDERTILELLNPDEHNELDLKYERNFAIEIHRRIISPLLTLSFAIISCAALLIGPVDRRDQTRRIILAIAGVIMIQGLYLTSYNLARENDWGLLAMYILITVPIALGLFLLSSFGDQWRRKLLYTSAHTEPETP